MEPSPTSLIGKTVGNFRIEQLLGTGGMGEVYMLRHVRLPNTVAALKVLAPKAATTPYVKERFIQEALVAAAVGSHRVARPIDIGRFDDGSPYIILELAAGRTLSQELTARGPLPVAQALLIAHRVADTMTLVHARGIVHRDLKPSNLMLDGDPANPRVKILDFGVARPPADLRLAHTVEHAIVGSPGFMSPEAATGDTIDARSDVFSLGATLYRSLATDVPFPGVIGQGVAALLLGPPPTIASKRPTYLDPISATVEDLVVRMLAKEPSARPTMAEVRDVIAGLIDVPPELTESTSPILSPTSQLDDIVASTITVGHSGPALDLPVIRAQLEQICDAKLPTARIVDGRGRRPWVWLVATAAAAVTGGATMYAVNDSEPVQVNVTPTTPELPAFTATKPQQITFSGTAQYPTVSRDGRRLAYVSGRHSDELVIQELETGHARIVYRDRSTEISNLRWSPNGRELLVNTAIVNPDNGSVRRRINGCRMATWAPDGTEVVWHCQPASDPRHWQFVSSQGKTSRTVKTDIPGAVFYQDVDWSSTGRLLVLISNQRGFSLWTFRPDGSELREVYRDEKAVNVAQVRWSADGNRIYLLRQRDRAPELLALAFDPITGARELGPVGPTGLALDGWSYSMPIDEQGVYFTRHSTQRDLAVVSRDRILALTSGTEDKASFALSPDKTTIAMPAGSEARMRLQLLPVAGGASKAFAPIVGTIHDVAWSPDGTELVYSVNHEGNISLWRMVVATGTTTRVPVTNLSESGEVEWAPAREILYLSSGNRSYRLFDPETSKSRPLIADDSVGWMFSARLSPDGRNVLVLWNRKIVGLWLISLADGTASQLYGEFLWPVGWSKDGTSVFGADYGVRTKIFAIDVRTRESRLAFDSPTRSSHGVALDDSSFVLMTAKSSYDLWGATTSTKPIPLPNEVEPVPSPVITSHAKPTNLGMEVGTLGGIPEGWFHVSPDLTVSLVDRDVPVGRQAVVLESSEPAPIPRVLDQFLVQRIDAAPYRGRRVRMRAQMRVEESSAGLIRLAPVIDGRVSLIFAPMFVDTPTPWQTQEVIADVRPDAEHIELILGGVGKVWFDDVSVEIVKQ